MLQRANVGCCCPTGRRNLALVTPDAFEAAACANAAWLEDMIMHLLCVLALDRFADYVSDQVGVVAYGMCMMQGPQCFGQWC